MQRGGLLIWTGLAMVAALILWLLFVSLLMAVFFAGGSVCSSGGVIDSSGTQTFDQSCTGLDWRAIGLFGSLTSLAGAGLYSTALAIRGLARRWHSHMFSPTVWASVFAIPAAWVVWGLTSAPWNSPTVTCDQFGTCTSSTHFETAGLIFALFFVAIFVVPFLFSAFMLYSAWRIPPARFISRRRLR
jgi:hypothetical protein